MTDHPMIQAAHSLAPACSPLPLALDEYPLLRTYLMVPDADYLPPHLNDAVRASIPAALTTCPLPPAMLGETASPFPIGAEVDCWCSESDEEQYWGVVLNTGTSSSYPADEDEDDEAILLVQFDSDASEYWIPASWCDPLYESNDVWKAEVVRSNGNFTLLYSVDENAVNLFHRAFRILALTYSYANKGLLAGVNFSYDYGVASEAFRPSFPRNLILTEGVQTFQPVAQEVANRVDNKYLLYLRYSNQYDKERNGTAAEAFPVTYGSIHEALEDAEYGEDEGGEAGETLYFVKDAQGTRGAEIRVLRLSELKEEREVEEGKYVIQKAVKDLLTVMKMAEKKKEDFATAGSIFVFMCSSFGGKYISTHTCLRDGLGRQIHTIQRTLP